MSVTFEQKTTRIGAHAYKVTQLDAVTGRRAFTKLFKIAGPALAKIENGIDETSLGGALTELVTRLEPADVDYFCDVFAAVTEVSGGRYTKEAPQLDDVFALHFASNYLEMFQWLAFCLQVNFSSFFVGIGQLIAKLVADRKAKAASNSTSPTASTGGSGDS